MSCDRPGHMEEVDADSSILHNSAQLVASPARAHLYPIYPRASRGSPMRSRILRALLVCALFVTILTIAPAANDTPQALPFTQNWSDTTLIASSDNWTTVPGIVGYRGDALVSDTGVNPQTVLADGSATPVDVIANQTNPNGLTDGGVAEFEIGNPV